MKNEDLFNAQGVKVDLSPMIDMVFLLLIFFMVTANLVQYHKDPNVVIPLASHGKVPDTYDGRVVINIYLDGTIKNEMGDVLSIQDVENTMRQFKASNPDARLHLRMHANAPYRFAKEVEAASARGGVPTVIFSTHEL